MVTVQEALAEYNKQHGTTYPTFQALGLALVKVVLRETWLAKRRNEAQAAGIKETEGF